MNDYAQFVVAVCLIGVCLALLGVQDTFTRLADTQERAVHVQEQMLARQAVVDSIVWGIKNGRIIP